MRLKFLQIEFKYIHFFWIWSSERCFCSRTGGNVFGICGSGILCSIFGKNNVLHNVPRKVCLVSNRLLPFMLMQMQKLYCPMQWNRWQQKTYKLALPNIEQRLQNRKVINNFSTIVRIFQKINKCYIAFKFDWNSIYCFLTFRFLFTYTFVTLVVTLAVPKTCTISCGH